MKNSNGFVNRAINKIKGFFKNPKNVEDEKTVRQVRRSEVKRKVNIFNKQAYFQGGCMGRNTGAHFFKPSRGKIKGYMKTSNAA